MITNKLRHLVNALIAGVILLLAGVAVLVVAANLRDENRLSRRQIVDLAASNFGNYLTKNPLQIGWKMTAIRVTQDLRLVIDVKVILRRDAEVIKTRNARIKYSHLKLTCPPPDAEVFRTLPGEDTLWIRLHHQGDTLIEAGCPKAKSIVSIY